MSITIYDISSEADGDFDTNDWDDRGGNWTITSGAAECTDSTSETKLIWRADGNGEDTGGAYLPTQESHVIVDAAGYDTGAAVHCTTSQAYLASLDSGGNIDMYRWNGGSSYTLRSGNMDTYSAGEELAMEYDAGTDTYTARLEGASIGTFVDSAYEGNGGGPGMHAWGTSNGATGHTYSRAGDQAAGGSPVGAGLLQSLALERLRLVRC